MTERTRTVERVRYATIVADPPWPHDGFASSPDSSHTKPNPSRSTTVVSLPYGAMTVEEIKALDVARFAADACALFLWVTNRFLPDAFAVMSSWGFRYRQALVWHKTGNPSPFGGTVAPIHSEFLLVGRRGGSLHLGRLDSSVLRVSVPAANQHTPVRHSAKPETFLDLIESVSPGPYLELFARRNRLGWETWGNESLNHVEVA